MCLPASTLHRDADSACLVRELCLCLQISSMLAHLLFLRCNGGLEAATALPDTFGTQAFVAAAVATTVPDEFVADVQELHNGGRQIDLGELSSLCEHAKGQKVAEFASHEHADVRTATLQPACSNILQSKSRRCSMRAGSQTWVSILRHVSGATSFCQARSDMLHKPRRSVLLHTQLQTPLLHLKRLPAQVQAPGSMLCISESALYVAQAPQFLQCSASGDWTVGATQIWLRLWCQPGSS